MLDRAATDALRSRSPERLVASVHELLTDPENEQLREDSRDLMVALADISEESFALMDVSSDGKSRT